MYKIGDIGLSLLFVVIFHSWSIPVWHQGFGLPMVVSKTITGDNLVCKTQLEWYSFKPTFKSSPCWGKPTEPIEAKLLFL